VASPFSPPLDRTDNPAVSLSLKTRFLGGNGKLGLDVKQYPLKVYDEEGTLIGDYSADLFVDNRLIIELKAAQALADDEENDCASGHTQAPATRSCRERRSAWTETFGGLRRPGRCPPAGPTGS
jgi:PD-(D/E)XK nuclease superfamily